MTFRSFAGCSIIIVGLYVTFHVHRGSNIILCRRARVSYYGGEIFFVPEGTKTNRAVVPLALGLATTLLGLDSATAKVFA
jgi:hypothetical protein